MTYELLSNIDLEQLCLMFHINLIACVPKDSLPQMTCTNGCYIINLGDAESGGTHWLALFVVNKQAVYFDPFGQVPPLEINNFVKSRNLIISRDQIQNIIQVCCGYYVIAFLHYMTNHTEPLQNRLYHFLAPFDLDDTHQNDNILQNYFLELI